MKDMLSTGILRLTKAASLSVVVLAAPAAADVSEYKLQPGDTLDISITGAPELKQRAPIELGGDIELPLAGEIKVSGMSLGSARAKIAESLANRVYQQLLNDGREVDRRISANQVMVTVAEYRPISVTGDVATPGERPYRPGMTVRQAIANAGGYSLARTRPVDPYLQAADFRSDFEALLADCVATQAKIWRLGSELGEKGVNFEAVKAPIPAELTQRFLKAETEYLNARTADREKDTALLKDSIVKANLQLNMLEEKKTKDQEGVDADNLDYQHLRDLYSKGITQNARLSETRRAVLMSSQQLLQTVVEISNIERQRDEYGRQIEKIASQGRMDALRDLQAANLHLAEVKARLKTTGDKLMYAGLQSQLVQGTGGRPEIKVHRTGDSGPQDIVADEYLELSPGDVVEVTLDAKRAYAAFSQ